MSPFPVVYSCPFDNRIRQSAAIEKRNREPSQECLRNRNTLAPAYKMLFDREQIFLRYSEFYRLCKETYDDLNEYISPASALPSLTKPIL